MLKWKSYFGNAFWDRLSDKSAFWDRSALGKEKTRDSDAYPVQAGVFGFYDALRRLKTG